MKKFLLIIVIGLLLVSVPLTVYLVSQQQEIRKRAAPATTLTLTPPAVSKKVGDDVSFSIEINPGSNQVIAVDLYLQYDPTVLQATSITSGALFPTILASQAITGNIISISIGTTTTKPVTRAGIAATVNFKAIAPSTGAVSISFPSTNKVSALDAGSTNVLTQAIPASVTITTESGATLPSPTPTTAAGINLTPTPTSTVSAGLTRENTASTSGELEILTPTTESTTSARPQIEGKAPPGSTVTITIYSTPQPGTTVADANGNWVFVPTGDLAPGPHTIVVTSTDANGNTLTTNTTIVVEGTASANLENGIPISGTTSPTIILLSIGIILVLTGLGTIFLIK